MALVESFRNTMTIPEIYTIGKRGRSIGKMETVQNTIGIDRNQQRKMRTKLKIREASAYIFKNNGYSKATVSQIMNQAGLGYGTFYEYYKSKQDIIMEWASEVKSRITVEYTKLPLTERSLFVRTLYSIRNVFHTFNEYKDIFVILKEGRYTEPDLKKIYDEIETVFQQRVVSDLTWSFKMGVTRNIDQDVAMISIEKLVLGFGEYIIENQLDSEQIENYARHVSLLVKEALFKVDELPEQT
jgi:AcrR family transcriptional regulator